jgi:PAS domain S-box-containing protein
MPQCVWAAKADGEIFYCNRVWREYAGPQGGLTFFDAVPREELGEVRRAWNEALRATRSWERQQRLRRHDGQWRWHLCRMVPERDPNGQLVGWIATATDIDEHKQIEEANQRLLASEKEAREQAEIANRTKDEFLATVSHELRTPLNAILGWTRMLRTGAVEPKQLARVLETIERNARAQTQLIEDILDVSRIIAGKLRLNIQKTDLHAVTRQAMDAVRPAAEAKGVRLDCDLKPGSGEFAGDPDRLQQIIWNLLANAIKFTPREGRVEVRVERVSSSTRITVTDTGLGISPGFLPHVFDRFRQADSSITRTQGGLGLGLAIVRHLVEVHGGTVQAESEGEGKGSRFTVQMPLRAVVPAPEPPSQGNGHPEVPAGEPPAAAPALLSGLDVLVVEDEPDARELVSAVLANYGAQVRTVSSVDEALTQFRDRPPDVLLSDIGLPTADGYTLIRRVRELGQASRSKIPAAALTAFASPDDHRRALEAGFDAHVSKPIEPADLAFLVAWLTGRAPEQPRHDSTSVEAPATSV